MNRKPIPQKKFASFTKSVNHAGNTGGGKREREKEKIKKDLFQKRKDKKIQQWLSMFICSETWAEEGGRVKRENDRKNWKTR